MSVVKFFCPSGHPLNAPVNLVGKSGKCPKCNAQFVVPQPNGDARKPAYSPPQNLRIPDALGSSADINITLGSGIREGSGTGSRPQQDIFVFLCPNGHRLNGPSTLKGKLGQCPHCGAKFRVPDDNDIESENADLVDSHSAGNETVESIPPDALELVEPEPPFEEGVHPLAHVMNRLWYHKGDEGEVEILLTEGEMLAPEHYAHTLSTREYAVFATREGSGYQFSVIPWAHVRRINVRHVDHLPLGAFTE
jgi:hypothetical protein